MAVTHRGTAWSNALQQRFYNMKAFLGIVNDRSAELIGYAASDLPNYDTTTATVDQADPGGTALAYTRLSSAKSTLSIDQFKIVGSVVERKDVVRARANLAAQILEQMDNVMGNVVNDFLRTTTNTAVQTEAQIDVALKKADTAETSSTKSLGGPKVGRRSLTLLLTWRTCLMQSTHLSLAAWH